MSCYSGSATTVGVGTCQPGLSTCQADGTPGPCVGEVTPALDSCATPEDEDCNGLPCVGSGLWAKEFSASTFNGPSAVAARPGGGVVIAGGLDDIAEYGGGALTTAGGVDVFVASFDVAGNHLWSKRFGEGQDQQARGVAVDGAGNVIVFGDFGGFLDLGGGQLAAFGSPPDLFVAKFDAAGNHVWSTAYGGMGGAYARAVAVDSGGNIALTGTFGGTLVFGATTLTYTPVQSDVFLAKLDPSGNPLWSKGFGDASYQTSKGVAFGPSGEVVLSGDLIGAIDFGGGPLTSAGGYDIVLASFDNNGNHQWSKRFGTSSGGEVAGGVAVDAAGNVVLAANAGGTAAIDFGGGPLPGVGASQVQVARFTASGGHLWSERFGGNGGGAAAVAIDPDGSFFLTGGMGSLLDLGCGTMTRSGTSGSDVFVGRLDLTTGNCLWSDSYGDAGDQFSEAVAVDATGVYLVGPFGGAIDFGTGPLSNGVAFLAKLQP